MKNNISNVYPRKHVNKKKLTSAWALVTMLMGCTPMRDNSPTMNPDPASNPVVDPAGKEREITLSNDGDLVVMQTFTADEVREAFPGAVSYYIELDGEESTRIHLVDAAGRVLRLIQVDNMPAEAGNTAARVSFPPIGPDNCFAPPCPWETLSTVLRDGFTLERRGEEMMVSGRIGRSPIGVHGIVQDDGTVSRLTSTVTEPADAADIKLLTASMAVLRDLRLIIGTGPFVPDTHAASWGCTLGKTLGWLVVGGLMAGCAATCGATMGATCIACGALGTADAGLVGEIC